MSCQLLFVPDIASHEREVEHEYEETHKGADGGPEEKMEKQHSAQRALYESRVFASLIGALSGKAGEWLDRVRLRHVVAHVEVDRFPVQLVLSVTLHFSTVLRSSIYIYETLKKIR